VKNRHLSELEIQDYALGRPDYPNVMMEHITSCADCRAEIRAYEALFSDISALVIPQLKRHKARFSVDRFIAGFLVIFASSCIGIPIYVFRRNILYMFSGVPAFFIYAIVGSTSVFVITKIFLMYKKYQHQMQYLNAH
jgi:hypothetical protein